MERLRAALAEIASMRRDGLLTEEEVRSRSILKRRLHLISRWPAARTRAMAGTREAAR